MDIEGSDIMALYPTKVLLDKNKKPFIPFVTAESIKFNNTDKSLADMLYNRYTKEEVDNIIKNLGTIQVLRGRVDTYEDLLAIENPQAGDVYIVGTSETDNAEYIYIGTTWEKLGPLVDLSTLVTLDELANRLGPYATIAYVDALIKSRPVIESESSAAMTGQELHLAVLNKTLKDNVIVICTEDYLEYKTGHTYLISEAISEGTPIVDQLKALGFKVNISSTLNSKNAKYYYIAEKADGDIYAAYSQVSLDTSSSKFPESGWKTFGVARRSSSDPKFLYNDGYDSNKTLNYALTPPDSSSTADYYVPNFSGAVNATYSNDPTATAFTYYSNGEGELILVATDITPVQEIDTANLVTKEEYIGGLTNRPTFEQANQMIDLAIDEANDVRVLKYVGHFPDRNSLPFVGQESAPVTISYPTTLTSDLTNPNIDINAVKAIVKETYFIGMWESSSNYTLFGFNDPNILTNIEIIKKTTDLSQVTNTPLIAFHFLATSASTVTAYSNRTDYDPNVRTWVSWRYMPNTRGQNSTPKTFSQEVDLYISLTRNLCSNLTGRIWNYTKLITSFCDTTYTGDNKPNSIGKTTTQEMVLQFANNFAYTYDMAMLKFDANYQPVWLTTEGDCSPNDVASYGEHGDHCRFNGEAWVPMGMQSDEILEQVESQSEVLSGTAAPTDDMGNDGDIYIQIA